MYSRWSLAKGHKSYCNEIGVGNIIIIIIFPLSLLLSKLTNIGIRTIKEGMHQEDWLLYSIGLGGGDLEEIQNVAIRGGQIVGLNRVTPVINQGI